MKLGQTETSVWRDELQRFLLRFESREATLRSPDAAVVSKPRRIKYSVEREEFQKLALLLASRFTPEGKNALIFSSARRRAGTTTVLLALAGQLTRALGVRPLVVELNRVRPSLQRKFHLDPSRSVYAIATEGRPVQDCVQNDPSGIAMIPAGGDWPGAMVTQISDRILEQARKHFDVILFDAPALLESVDALAAGAVVKDLVLVVRAGTTSSELLTQVKRHTDNGGMRIVGSVLTIPRGPLQRWFYR